MPGLTIKRTAESALKIDPKNARKHGRRNLDAIAGSLKRFGQRAPLVVRPDGTVIGGNATLQCMRELGMVEVDVVEFDGTDQEAAALALSLNRAAELAAWNDEQLAETLAGLDRDLALAAGWLEDELRKTILDFQPATLEQPRLDKIDGEQETYVKCPECGHEFPRT